MNSPSEHDKSINNERQREDVPGLLVLQRARTVISEYGQPIAKLGALIGLLITCIYFIKSGSIPLDSLSSLGALAGVVATIALFTALAFLAFWVMPPAISLLFQQEDPDGQLSHWFLYKADGQKLTPSQQRFRRLFFAAVSSIPFWIWLIAVSMPDIFYTETWLRGSVAVTTVAVVILCVWYGLLHPSAAPAQQKAGQGQRLSVALHRLLFLITHAAMNLFPLCLFLVLVLASDFRHDSRVPVLWALLSGGGALVTGVNYVGLGVVEQVKGVRAFGVLALIGLFSLLLLVIALGASERLLEVVMKASSVRLENTTLALDSKTCAVVRALGVKTISERSDGDFCLLENATVISRIGERWVIACDRTDSVTDDRQRSKRRNFQVEAKSVQAIIDVNSEVRDRTKSVALCDLH